MREPVDIGGRQAHTSISVGIAHFEAAAEPKPPGDGRHAERRRRPGMPSPATLGAAAMRESTAQLLLRQADTAMYAAKGAGKSRVVLAEVVLGTATLAS
jgi:GGDEF domain-containing protein